MIMNDANHVGLAKETAFKDSSNSGYGIPLLFFHLGLGLRLTEGDFGWWHSQTARLRSTFSRITLRTLAVVQ